MWYLKDFTIIEYYFFLTLINISILSFKDKLKYGLLVGLIVINVSNVIISHILFHCGKSISFISTIYIILHQLIWFMILFANYKFLKKIIFITFIIFSCLNLLFIEKILKFNTLTFIFGSFIYLIFYIFNSFKQLKNEKLFFFQTNNFILISAPTLFFLGLSFIFSFQSKLLTSLIVFGSIKLYTLINYFVNIIYYSLINLYIYKERKLQNAT